jgi:hypothetical protein
MKLALREDKLLETVEKIGQRIDERFPGSGLSLVATNIVETTKQAVIRAEAISRPNLVLRAALGLLVVIALGGIYGYVRSGDDSSPPLTRLWQFLDATKGSAAVLGAAALFFVTLETRLKRRRALQAVHELRGLAHIIDMHQLTKDPDRLGHPDEPLYVAGRQLDADSMGRYLHYCTELLAVISKIGQLYVQDFPDAGAVTAVDHFENLATGLASKIWQKIMILDRIRTETGPVASASPGRATGPTEATGRLKSGPV